jgi:hypothetical protein
MATVHEVLIDPAYDRSFPNEVVGTFSGQVPVEGQRLSKEVLRPPDDPKLKEFPRYREEHYVVTRVKWTLTDEGTELRARVYVALPHNRRKHAQGHQEEG